MKNIVKKSRLVPVVLMLLCSIACDKFLDMKPDKKLAVPESLDDLQALMNDYTTFTMDSPAGEISSGDYTITDAVHTSLSSDFHRRMYSWDESVLFEEGTSTSDWARYYSSIYSCNTVLESLQNLSVNTLNKVNYNLVMGKSLFWRAQKLFQASLIWCDVYREGKAAEQLGMPLRLGTDFNERSIRSTLAETYKQILEDASRSVALLPEKVSHPVEPGRCAAYMLLARIYLYMGNYEKSYLYADSAWSIKRDLIDYTTIDSKPTYPIARFNNEIIYHSSFGSPQILTLARAHIVKELVDSYDSGDLRKELYFSKNADETYGFRGRYSGTSSLFYGYATDELYLIRAESAVRTNRLQSALKDINTLLSTRWGKTNGVSIYVDIEEQDREKLLEIILSERRKSLVLRGLRWYDLKRLNRDGANITLKRIVGGREYVLRPNDLRYALPIPEDIVRLSDIEQNPR